MKNNRIGVVVPIKEEHVKKLFEKERDVFIKFSNLILEPEYKIIFYMSGKGILVGQAKIIDIKEMLPESAWSSYGNRIFLDKKEFGNYSKISPITGEKRKGKLKVLLLDEKREYRKPIISSFIMTAAGRYLTEDMFEEILKQLND
ncbi:MAG: DUF365 domain-containing protein [Candidatus Lokiarchaeota archaeon]|nr:DUF365 domain-containing protein [Candidatus Lokiarchaeota archaeon]